MTAAAFLFYLAQVSVYALAFWVIYQLIWRGRPLLRGSRIFLLASLVVPVVLPFVRLALPENAPPAVYSISLPEVRVGGATSAGTGFSIAQAVVAFYLLIVSGLAFLFARSFFILNKKLAGGIKQDYSGYSLILSCGIGPGTIGKRIFFPGKEVNEVILRHELGHIHSGHRFDALLMHVVHVLLWCSPAHWLLRRSLKLVHEYEADRAAISGGDDIEAYGKLMLSQSLGVENAAIAHSFFHHPLKHRIEMLHAFRNPARKRLIYATATCCILLFTGVIVLAQSKKSARQKPASSRSAGVVRDTIVTVNPVTGKEEMMVTTRDADQASPAFEKAPANERYEKDTVMTLDPESGKERSVVYTRVVPDAGVNSQLNAGSNSASTATSDNTATMPDGRVIYKAAGQMPQFDGNLPAWLSSNIKYPDAARKAGQQGRSIIQFVVSETGQISDAKIVRSSGFPALDNEAMRVVNAMPRWNPGKENGVAVPVLYTLPVSFKLD